MSVGHRFVCFTLVVCAAALSGCATLYSETRDQQGKAAKEAWQKVDLAPQITKARKNHAALLAKQLELEDTVAKARRDLLIQAMATGGTLKDKLADPLNGEVLQLGGTQPKAWLAALDKEAAARRILQKFENEFRRAGVEMPACDKMGLPSARAALDAWIAAHPGNPFGQTTVQLATQACQKADMTATQRIDLAGTSLQSTRDTLEQAEAVLTDLRSKGLDERNLFRAAKAEYDAAAQALAAGATDARDKVQAAVKKLQTLSQTLGRLDDAFSVQFVSEEQKKWLDKLLDTVAKTPAGQAPPTGSSDAAIALVLLPDLLDSARTALADASKPSLVPLVLAKNLAQTRADAAARDVATQEALVALQRQKLQSQTLLLQALTDAQINVQELVAHQGPGVLGIRVAAGLQPLDPGPKPGDEQGQLQVQDKMRWWKAATLYLDAQSRLGAEVNKIDYQINAIQYERAIAYAESNIAQWNALISTSVDQLAAFGASGIKAQDIVALLNSVTLLWIGKGVN